MILVLLLLATSSVWAQRKSGSANVYVQHFNSSNCMADTWQADDSGMMCFDTTTQSMWIWTGTTWRRSPGQNAIIPDNIKATGQVDEYCLTYEATGDTWEWQACAGGGGGDVTGPGSSADNALVRFDGATGKIIQDYTSGAPTSNDTGSVTIPIDLTIGPSSGSGLTLTRNTTAESFVKFSNVTSGDLAQVRGIDGGGLRITDGSSATEWWKVVSGDVTIPNGDLTLQAELFFDKSTELTISAGVVTLDGTATVYGIRPEVLGVQDDLDTINGGTDGQLISLFPSGGVAEQVVLKHGTGNIWFPDGSDVEINNDYDTAQFIYKSGVNQWRFMGPGLGSSVKQSDIDSSIATHAAIANSHHEKTEAADTTLTLSGDDLQINLANANDWTGEQDFQSTTTYMKTLANNVDVILPFTIYSQTDDDPFPVVKSSFEFIRLGQNTGNLVEFEDGIGNEVAWITRAGSYISDIFQDQGGTNFRISSAPYFQGVSTGANGGYDLTLGSGDLAGLKLGQVGLYASSFSASGMDLGGAFLFRQEGNLEVGNDPGIEFAWMEQGNTARLLIPESGAGNATAFIRSGTFAGPYSVVTGNDTVLCDTWTAFDSNIDCDTGGTGADLFVQDDLEVEGTIFAHETINLEGATADGNQVIIQVGADPGADVTITLPTASGALVTGAHTTEINDLDAAVSGTLPLVNLTDDDATADLCLVSGGAGGDPNYKACPAGSETNTLSTVTTGIGDDQFVVGSGVNTAAYDTVSDCDAAGAALTYDVTTNDVACATDLATDTELAAQDECSEITGCVVSAITSAGVTYENLSANADIGFGAAQVPQGSLTAPLASPVLTGDPTGPTPAGEDSDTSLATTAYVQAEVQEQDACSEITGCVENAITSTGVTYESLSTNGDIGFGASQVPQGSLAAPLASPALTGDPTVPTASANDSDTSAASTAFVQQEINGAGGQGLTCASGSCDIAKRTACWTLFDPSGLADTDDIPSVWRAPAAVTITEIWCETDAGSPTINPQRDDGSAANMCTSNLTCTTGGATCTLAAAEDNLADGDRIDHVTVSASTADRINVCVEYTVD
jgi:hypothetical protein